MRITQIKNRIKNQAKNLVGWKTPRKIVVWSVDDYGNVRIGSKKARNELDQYGLKAANRFDAHDTLETREDLEMLFETLSKVKGQNGRNPVFTPFAVPCNLNFEAILGNGMQTYVYEPLPETFQKLEEQLPEVYRDAWNLWREGIREGLMAPQFHGREHLNVRALERLMQTGNTRLMRCLQTRSFIDVTQKNNGEISPLAAFDFRDLSENDQFHTIIKDGLNRFEQVFGYRATHFTPPVYKIHHSLNPTLKRHGIRFIDKPMFEQAHQGSGKYKWRFNYTGKSTEGGPVAVVRNVVFEPTADRQINWPDFALQQIEAAFRWKRPAVISSHRVNFCGQLDENNRRQGLNDLEELLKKVVRRWPDVEFMAADELGRCIAGKADV